MNVIKRILGALIIVSALVLFVICGYKIKYKVDGYKASQMIYDNIRNISLVSISGASIPVMGTEHTIYNDKYKSEKITIDWDKVDNANGWIILGDKINYPIMCADNNSYYLNHAYDGSYNANGAIFLNYKNDSGFNDYNSIIYGHNSKNGAMFGSLRGLIGQLDKGVYFDIYTPNLKRNYKVIAVLDALDSGEAFRFQFDDYDAFNEHIARIMSGECSDIILRDSIPLQNYYNHIVTLSTCSPLGSAQGWRTVVIAEEIGGEAIG